MIRHVAADGLRAQPGRLMASIAIRIRRGERVIVVDVAVRAGHHFARGCQLVRTHQRPAGGAVVKRCRRPGNRVVAC